MTESERKYRVAIVYQHHLAYGMNPEEKSNDPRVKCFLNETCPIPIEILKAAFMLSRQLHTGQWPPTQGAVVEAAVRIEWDRAPDYYRAPNGGSMAKPRWHKRMTAGRPAMYAVRVA